MAVNLTKSPASVARGRAQALRLLEIVNDTENAFAMAAGFPVFDADRDCEKAARRARYERRRSSGRTQKVAR